MIMNFKLKLAFFFAASLFAGQVSPDFNCLIRRCKGKTGTGWTDYAKPVQTVSACTKELFADTCDLSDFKTLEICTQAGVLCAKKCKDAQGDQSKCYSDNGTLKECTAQEKNGRMEYTCPKD